VLPDYPDHLITLNAMRFRNHWALAPGIAFLNHGSFGACPKPILALQAKVRARMEAEPVQFLWRNYEERLEPARATVAAFVGARPEDLVFVTNATSAVNAVLRSFKLRSGDELLTTDHEYNACHNVLVQAARDAGARLVVARVPFPVKSEDEIIEAILDKVTRRTRLAMLDHITSNTALVFPIARLTRELESRGVETFVDGAHAPGMISLDICRLRPAFYTGNLHKWVCAPKGAAFVWVRPDLQPVMQPAIISHGHNTHRPGYSQFQDRFDWAGTFDPTAWFCAAEAILWMGRLSPGGWKTIQRTNRDLAVRARRLLCRQLELEPPCPETLLGAMATLPLPTRLQDRPRSGKIDAEQLRLYDEFRIEVPLLRFGQPERRYFRISAQLYNILADYERLAHALRTL
jgi:isopenicillin-N epimerase